MSPSSVLKRTLFFLLFLFFATSCSGPAEEAPQEPTKIKVVKPEVKNPDTFVFEDYGTVRTLDPACAYDNVSHQRIMNIYEPLIAFDGSATDAFVPVLAEEVPTVENGGISDGGKTYTFKIRKGVTFHAGGTLSPEDVAYSLKRHMVVDQDGGPIWMLLEALVGETSTRTKGGTLKPGIFEKIDACVAVSGDTVVLTLPRPFPPLLALLAYANCGAILDKEWTIEHGGWDGTLETAAAHNNPAFGAEPLHHITNGTGAYTMLTWEPSKVFIFQRFDGYWGEEPALKTAVIRYNKEWSSRKLALQNGDADRVLVDTQYLSEVQAMKDVVIHAVPQLSVTAALFCRQVNPEANPNIGSGKLDGEGIPPDFFADPHVRKAFLHAFDRGTYAKDVWDDRVVMPTSPNASGMPYNIRVPIYDFDLEMAKEEMKQAWGGELWKKGFKMVITHNTGNAQREAAAHMLAENIMSLSPKFQIEVRNVDWKDYTVAYRKYRYPIFIIGWGADYPDPDNFMFTFMSSEGVYGKYMAYENEEVDRLCKEGRFEVDPEKRRVIYERLQNLWYEEAIGCMIYQKIDNFVYRSNIRGFVPHPMLDTAWEDLKRLSKSHTTQ
ncbi:ABC transporter substrate-binding protein [Desulfoluna butyratoxydans]|uniref:Solute-binding protein family 5 domain n=1 Tax=Desulfoluna butyratoxydans TaxID=231438 RepID=A0A4U8YHG7_9BACT|nr:ABC transporter substrate-binding protein [Desulfoluna butyratoxydans]VFQ43005.1 solute-binding protein family 5 domain [Desulfoluna butyratoxydans]